jgi:hypothetical protein
MLASLAPYDQADTRGDGVSLRSGLFGLQSAPSFQEFSAYGGF